VAELPRGAANPLACRAAAEALEGAHRARHPASVPGALRLAGAAQRAGSAVVLVLVPLQPGQERLRLRRRADLEVSC
jgi:hypothetical protein